MLSKNQLKLITRLRQKKYRLEHQLFVAEGAKVVDELLGSTFELEKLFCTEAHFDLVSNYDPQLITENELKKISNLSSPNKVLGLFKIPEQPKVQDKGLRLVLDAINDPGNLGTIIRLSDWFGVSHLICSNDTVDCYNPKVVQSTMGSLARLPISYLDIETYTRATKAPVYGAFMEGEIVYSRQLERDAILIMGNESKGISKEVEALVQAKITIPKLTSDSPIESLNVATATAILLNEFGRNTFTQK